MRVSNQLLDWWTVVFEPQEHKNSSSFQLLPQWTNGPHTYRSTPSRLHCGRGSTECRRGHKKDTLRQWIWAQFPELVTTQWLSPQYDQHDSFWSPLNPCFHFRPHTSSFSMIYWCPRGRLSCGNFTHLLPPLNLGSARHTGFVLYEAPSCNLLFYVCICDNISFEYENSALAVLSPVGCCLCVRLTRVSLGTTVSIRFQSETGNEGIGNLQDCRSGLIVQLRLGPKWFACNPFNLNNYANLLMSNSILLHHKRYDEKGSGIKSASNYSRFCDGNTLVRV